MSVPKFALNRFDSRSIALFAEDVKRAENLGWDAALQGDTQLRRRDIYVMLAAAAGAIERIHLGPFVANPITRHPSVTASSIATIDELAPGRTLLGMGTGNNAVKLAGLPVAKVKDLEDATRTIKALLAGESLEVGAARPMHLPHHRPVPVWIAAAGPRTLQMAGAVADGVFIEVGTSPANIQAAVDGIRAGAVQAGRDPASVRFAAVIHAVLLDDAAEAVVMAKSIAAHFYERTHSLFTNAGLEWNGPPPEEIRREQGIWMDFLHHPDLKTAGRAVDFLPQEVADRFCLWGGPGQIAEQLISLLRAAPVAFDYVVLHPIPDPQWPNNGEPDYTARMPGEVLGRVRDALS